MKMLRKQVPLIHQLLWEAAFQRRPMYFVSGNFQVERLAVAKVLDNISSSLGMHGVLGSALTIISSPLYVGRSRVRRAYRDNVW